jgi:hypothetical protein
MELLNIAGYTVRVMWECDFMRELNTNGLMQMYFDDCDLHEPLDPREAFFGGRTNCRQMHFKVCFLCFLCFF